jgi:hypothetical protein
MPKSRKNVLKSVNSGLTSVGKAAKSVAKQTFPIIDKSVTAVYDTMGKGFDLGVKSVKSVTKGRKMSGGRKYRRTRRHRRR